MWSRPEQAPGAAGHSVLLVPSALPLHLVPDPPPAAPPPTPREAASVLKLIHPLSTIPIGVSGLSKDFTFSCLDHSVCFSLLSHRGEDCPSADLAG